MKMTIDFPSEWVTFGREDGDYTLEIIESDKNSHEKYIEIMQVIVQIHGKPVRQSLYWNTLRHELSLGDRHA
jgi:hypothetical protein